MNLDFFCRLGERRSLVCPLEIDLFLLDIFRGDRERFLRSFEFDLDLRLCLSGDSDSYLFLDLDLLLSDDEDDPLSEWVFPFLAALLPLDIRGDLAFFFLSRDRLLSLSLDLDRRCEDLSAFFLERGGEGSDSDDCDPEEDLPFL